LFLKNVFLIDFPEGDKFQRPFNPPLDDAALWQRKRPESICPGLRASRFRDNPRQPVWSQQPAHRPGPGAVELIAKEPGMVGRVMG